MIDRWFIAVNGIVTDVADPERAHRIRCLIPDVSEEIVHDQWIEPMMPWVGPDGYGPAHLPEPGSEVLLFGRKGQKYELFYLCRYNENFRPPAEFAGGARGLKTDTAYKLLADLLIHVISQQAILVQAATQADVKGQVVRLLGGDSQVVRVEPDKIGFLGAAAAPRQQLAGPAHDLATAITLVNSIRAALITDGLGQ